MLPQTPHQRLVQALRLLVALVTVLRVLGVPAPAANDGEERCEERPSQRLGSDRAFNEREVLTPEHADGVLARYSASLEGVDLGWLTRAPERDQL